MNGDENSLDAARWRASRTARGNPAEEGGRLAGTPPDLKRILLFAGLSALLLGLGMLLPANWKSLHPALLERAGQGTSSVSDLGLAAVAAQKPGVANLALTAAQSLKDDQVAKLRAALVAGQAKAGAAGRDAYIDGIFRRSTNSASPTAEAMLPFLLIEANRAALREHLASSRSPGGRAILATRDLSTTVEFIPVNQPGGQPFEATILLAALLYEGERFAPTLAQDIRQLAERTSQTRLATEWESFCFDLLALGRRLDWLQLSELLRLVPNLKALNGFAQLVQVTPDDLPLFYSAALLAQSPDRVATYLLRFGKAGLADLTRAIAQGEGAVRLLVGQQMPVGPARGWVPGFLAAWTLKAPRVMLATKVLLFLLAGLVFFLVWRELSPVQPAGRGAAGVRMIHFQRSVAAGCLALLLLAAEEPLLFKPLGSSDFRLRLKLPVLTNSPVPTSKNTTVTKPSMELSTILSVLIFAALQVGVYSVCLMKIREIEMSPGSPQLKLRLMENEENLFDSGLYIGIAGTATALVLQVVGVIKADLLAAYASNLFGIVCVALIKIRHVRAAKHRLILESQAEPAPQPVLPLA